MESVICPVALIVVGGAMFVQWRRAKEAQEGTSAFLWMAASLIVTAFGLIGLLGALSSRWTIVQVYHYLYWVLSRRWGEKSPRRLPVMSGQL